jgi:DNA-binding transcriptional MerR regulator
MAWSTRELAELAGTTVNTVRHYHRLGLLAEPERRYNGYKQYAVTDLVRLLRIRRLAELGIPLARVADILDEGSDTSDDLRALDDELVAGIERLQRARQAIATIERVAAPVDGPAGFEELSSFLSEADSSIIHIYRQLYDESAMEDLRRMVADDPTPPQVRAELDALTDDADEATRDRLASALAPALYENMRDYPWLQDPAGHLSRGENVTRDTFLAAVVELYNAAQRDVLARASVLASERLTRDRADGEDPAGPRP